MLCIVFRVFRRINVFFLSIKMFTFEHRNTDFLRASCQSWDIGRWEKPGKICSISTAPKLDRSWLWIYGNILRHALMLEKCLLIKHIYNNIDIVWQNNMGQQRYHNSRDRTIHPLTIHPRTIRHFYDECL